MFYLVSFFIFTVLILFLGSISFCGYSLIVRKKIEKASINDIILFSSVGWIAVLLLIYPLSYFVSLNTILTTEFYIVLSILGAICLIYLKPIITKQIWLHLLIYVSMFFFICFAEISNNTIISFGGNGDYHNHERIARYINDFSLSERPSNLNDHFFGTLRRVTENYRYPLGAHYLLIFLHGFEDVMLTQPHFVSIHKFFFTYALLLALTLATQFLPKIKWSWLPIIACFSYPLLHVIVGMDSISQEISLFLVMLLLFLPSFDTKLILLPLLVFITGLVYYYSLVLLAPFLIYYAYRLFKRKSWLTLQQLIFVTILLLGFYYPNITSIEKEVAIYGQNKYTLTAQRISQIIGAIPNDFNPAYLDSVYWEKIINDNSWKVIPTLLLFITLFGVLVKNSMNKEYRQKHQAIYLLTLTQLIIITGTFFLTWRYFSHKFLSFGSISFLWVGLQLVSQDNKVSEKIFRVALMILTIIFLTTSWSENYNWLRISNGKLSKSDSYQWIVSHVDSSVLIHRNIHFASLIVDETLHKKIYTHAVYSNNFDLVLPFGEDYHSICNFSHINRNLVSRVFVERGACLNEKLIENWDYHNQFNSKIFELSPDHLQYKTVDFQ